MFNLGDVLEFIVDGLDNGALKILQNSSAITKISITLSSVSIAIKVFV